MTIERIMQMAVRDTQASIKEQLEDLSTEIGASGVRDFLKDLLEDEWDDRAFEEEGV